MSSLGRSLILVSILNPAGCFSGATTHPAARTTTTSSRNDGDAADQKFSTSSLCRQRLPLSKSHCQQQLCDADRRVISFRRPLRQSLLSPRRILKNGTLDATPFHSVGRRTLTLFTTR
jgi:hypothetical protein